MQSAAARPGRRGRDRRPQPVLVATAAALLATSLAAACATSPAGSASPLPTGDYAGQLTVGGRSFGATLRLRPDGRTAVRGLLQVVSPIEIEGRVAGRVVDDLLRLTIEYEASDGCASRIEGILDMAGDGDRLDGPVTVFDCGEPIAGRIRVTRGRADGA